MTDDLDRLEALCAAATPGANTVSGPGEDGEYWVRFGDPMPDWKFSHADSTWMTRADAEYTAAARTALPALIARVQELEAMLADEEAAHQGTIELWNMTKRRANALETRVRHLKAALGSFGVLACTPEWDEQRRQALADPEAKP
jgi:hypothetical protein